jgi:hypothetical protein
MPKWRDHTYGLKHDSPLKKRAQSCRPLRECNQNLIFENKHKIVELSNGSKGLNDSMNPYNLRNAKECGINIDFPGISEKKERYIDRSNMKQCGKFTINPQSYTNDRLSFSKPFFYPLYTEYYDNYCSNDKKEIYNILPWQREN